MKSTQKDEKFNYVNFPITMLKDFLKLSPEDKAKRIFDWFCYGAYSYHSKQYLKNSELNRQENPKEKKFSEYLYDALDKAGMKDLKDKVYEKGRMLLKEYGLHNVPMTGAKISVLLDFNTKINLKSSFEFECLLAHLALKSIIGPNFYAKTNKAYLFSRMSGSSTRTESKNMHPLLLEYNKEYQFKKLILHLEESWGLKYYSYFTRGFYVSYRMSKENLILEAEKNRRKNKNILKKREEVQMRKAAQSKVDKLINPVKSKKRRK